MPKNYFTNQIENNTAFFDEHETGHLRVMKASVGEKIEFTDGNGYVYKGIIKNIGKKISEIEIEEKYFVNNENDVDVNLFVSNMKWPKESIIIEKAVELGVKSINLVNTERSVVKKYNFKKIEYNVRKALKQCGGTVFPNLREYESLYKIKDCIVEKNTNSIILDPYSENRLTPDKFSKNIVFNVFIGPEGGFTEEEMKYLKELGVKGYNIGKRVLRSETAVIAILSLIILS